MRTRNAVELDLVLDEASEIAGNVGQTFSTTHILLSLFTVPSSAQILLRERGIDEDRILGAIRRMEPEGASVIDELVARTHTLARQAGRKEATCLHLLVAILRTRSLAAHRLLDRVGLDVITLRNQAMGLLTGTLPRRYRVPEPAPPRPREHQRTRPAPRWPGQRAAAKQATTAQARPRAASLEPDHARATAPNPRELEEAKLSPDLLPEAKSNPSPLEPPDKATAEQEEDRKAFEDPYALDPERCPWLCTLGRNLTSLAAQGTFDPLVGRDQELDEIIDILGKRRTNNPILVGEPGVGKTAIVEGLAMHALTLGERAGPIGSQIIIELDMASLLAGTHLRGSFSEKLGGLKDEVRTANGRIVIFIDEIHTLIGAGATGEGPQDAANELKSALSRGEFPCIGATTYDEFRTFIESDPALERRFTPVQIKEPDIPATVSILSGLRARYEAHHGVVYDTEALEAAARLAERYVSDRCLPDKAIGIMDLAGSRARREGVRRVGVEGIARVVSKIAKVPEERLLLTDQERLLSMESALAERVIGHSNSIAKIAAVIRRNYAGFDSHRPMGSFLLAGATGVGKTELAKALADFLYGGADSLVRCDMSEFSEANTVSRLIGAPPGYVGYGDGGQLTEAVRRRPFCVVLLDEIEKAHSEVLQLLLQVMDEGHLTDGRGRQISFTNTVLLLTSNLGGEAFTGKEGRRLGFASQGKTGQISEQSDAALETARRALAPELWNRIDERLAFPPLDKKELRAIAALMLKQSAATLKQERSIVLQFDEALLDHLIASGGFDRSLGARPMRQTIQRLVEAPIAEAILRGELRADQALQVSVMEGLLQFSPVPGQSKGPESEPNLGQEAGT